MTMGLYEIFLQPFVEFGFMRRALVACVALALGSAPMGTLLVLRRMSLMGDAMRVQRRSAGEQAVVPAGRQRDEVGRTGQQHDGRA